MNSIIVRIDGSATMLRLMNKLEHSSEIRYSLSILHRYIGPIILSNNGS